MNAEKRKRVPKPDWKKSSRMIRQNEMVAIAEEYQKRLQKERSEDILGDLSSRYSRDSRTIQRYVSRGKKLIAEKETTSDPRLMKHLDELARTAETLAHQGARLLRYKDNANVEAVGGVLSHLYFWWKPNKTIVEENADSTAEFTYESGHPIGPYLVRLLYIHYEEQFGKPPFKEWNQLSTGNVNREILDNLKFLAHGGLKPCPNCPICLQG